MNEPLPNIGPDPLKGSDLQLDSARERLRKAMCHQQKGVPNQTALVWRVDISRVLNALTVAEGRLEYLRYKETLARNN